MEGATDIQYLTKASELLGYGSMLDALDIQDGEGDRLRKTWSSLANLPDELVRQAVVVLHDCDFGGEPQAKGKLFKRVIPKQEGHPIAKGIENLFSTSTIQKAREHKSAFIDISSAHTVTERGQERAVPEEWTVNAAEKMNLCNWICENGTAEDFASFTVVFDLLKEAVETDDA